MNCSAWLGAAALLAGCSGEGNSGRPEPDIELWSQIPWANHATPQFIEHDDGSLGDVKLAGAPVFPAIGQNLPDPGSRAIDCSALDAIELSPYWVDTFEPPAPGANPTTGQPYWGVAKGWAAYDDGSDGSFRTPGDVGWYPDLGGGNYLDEAHPGMPATPYAHAPSAPWGLAADRHPRQGPGQTGVRPACDGEANDWVLHFRGGRFNYYGGGAAHPFSPPLDAGLIYPEEEGWMFHEICPPGSDLCPENPELFEPVGADAFIGNRPSYWDVRAYDGVVFWARRGPDGAPGMLVGLQNKDTSDDLARENQTYCRRIKPCKPTCSNGFECIEDENPDEPVKRCMPAGYDTRRVQNPALREYLFPRCEEDTCKPAKYYPDPDFADSECQPYSFSGLETEYWCFEPGDAPAAPPERCGDSFVAPIVLSTDWQLYTIPFDEFRQVGYGKRAPSFDLKTLYSIFFGATVGYADVYIDNVSFYRKK